MTVRGHSRKVTLSGDTRPVVFQLKFLLLVVNNGAVIRVDNDHARAAIHNQKIAVRYNIGCAFQAHNSRNFQGLCHDGRMGSPPPHIGNKPHDPSDIQFGGVRRGKIVGHDNDPSVDFRKALLGFSAKRPQNPFGDIFHIADTVADIFVINLVENFTDFFQGFFQCPLGINFFILDCTNSRIPKHAVLEDHQMAVQNKGEIVDFLRHSVLEGLHLFFDHSKGLFEPLHLSIQMFCVYQILIQDLDFASVHEMGFANDNTRINGYAL